MAKRASLRASDADREAVSERLRKAALEGRILAHELEERLARALRAKTYGELDEVVADLPDGRVSHVPQQRRGVRVATKRPVATVAILVAVTLVTLVVAALVLVGLMAFSGVWVLFAFFWIARGGPRHPRHHRQPRYRGYRNMAGRW